MHIEPYQRARRAACQYCAEGMQLSQNPRFHWTGNRNPPACTAPSLEEYVESLAKRVEQHDLFEHKLAFILTGVIERYMKLEPCPAIRLANEIAVVVANTEVNEYGFVVPKDANSTP